MSGDLDLAVLGSTRGEKRLLRRIGVVAVAVVLGAGLGVRGYAWGSGIESKIDNHLAEVRVTRPQMDEYVREERAARCASARNVFRLCMAARVECEPVDARCRP